MMLGKPVICYSSPDWIDAIREEIPDYVHELPVISTSPNTVDRELRNLIVHPENALKLKGTP